MTEAGSEKNRGWETATFYLLHLNSPSSAAMVSAAIDWTALQMSEPQATGNATPTVDEGAGGEGAASA